MTAAEQELSRALRAVFEERAEMRPEPKYWYPLSRVTYDAREIEAVCDALCSTETTMGRRVAEFERRFAALHGREHAVMVNSGSSADLLAAFLLVEPRSPLLAPGDEVLVPSVTWPTQIDSLLMAGLSVRLVDADPVTLAMDLDDVEAKISTRTRAISVVHLMGNPLDMDRLMRIAADHDLEVLEDACESLGAQWQGRPVGTFGLAGTYSFFFSHHMTTMEGGMVIAPDEETADNLRLLRAHGWSRHLGSQRPSTSDVDSRYEFLTWGLNVRPTEAAGAFGLVQLERLDGFQQNRARNARLVSDRLEGLSDRIRLMQVPAGATCSWFALPLMLTEDSPVDRNTLAERLEQQGVETRPVVAGNLARQPMTQFFDKLNASGPLPGADQIHERGLYIGLHPFEDDATLDRLCNTIERALA